MVLLKKILGTFLGSSYPSCFMLLHIMHIVVNSPLYRIVTRECLGAFVPFFQSIYVFLVKPVVLALDCLAATYTCVQLPTSPIPLHINRTNYLLDSGMAHPSLLIACTCDLHARAQVMNMMQFNGYYSCPCCLQKGIV